jgi:succinate-semialdehyde dehydrogenase/glutarate-semialdehyde dehydrogenase
MTSAQIETALDVAVAAQTSWAAEDMKVRGEVLRAAAALLRDRANDLAVLVTREMGKPVAESRAEVHKCATGLEFYADNAATYLADEPYDTDADRAWVSYEPVGVVLAVMPWNFPLWQVFRFGAPALMAGNAALLKHSPNTTGAALVCQQILADAGLPDGLFTALLVAEPDVPAVTERLISDTRIGAVTITGSERAGSAVGSVAGREIKKSVLELGGSDPFIVLADADLPRVAALAVKGRFLDAGATLLCGGHIRDDLDGFYYQPTVLGGITMGMSVYAEEVFGPVATIIVVADIDEAVTVANDTRFGLGASVWSADLAAAVAVGRRITAGACFINALVASDARMPFGGTKRSGYGRELAAAGIREFVNVRTWWAMAEPQPQAPVSE